MKINDYFIDISVSLSPPWGHTEKKRCDIENIPLHTNFERYGVLTTLVKPFGIGELALSCGVFLVNGVARTGLGRDNKTNNQTQKLKGVPQNCREKLKYIFPAGELPQILKS